MHYFIFVGGKKYMKKFRKYLVVGIILLFVGASVLPSINGTKNAINVKDSKELLIQEKNQIKEECLSTSSDVDWWPMFHHDPQHTGYSASQVEAHLYKNWSFKTDYVISSSPIVVDDKVYIGSADPVIHLVYMYCLNASNGNKIWEKEIESWHPYSPTTAAVFDDKIYFGGGQDGIFYCLNASTGKENWSFQEGGTVPCYLGDPTVSDGKVYFGSASCYWDDVDVLCLDAYNGDKIWSFDALGNVYNSPAVVDGRVYVGNDRLYCLNASNGNIIWNTTEKWFASSPTVANGKVYIGSEYDNKIYCFDANNGDELWNNFTDGFVDSTPAVAYGKIFVGSNDNNIYCFNAENGELNWFNETGGSIHSSPAVANDKVFIGSNDNKLYCLDVSDGEILWSFKTSGSLSSSPAIVNGKVYIVYDNELCVFEHENVPPEVSFIKPEYSHVYLCHGIIDIGPIVIIGKSILILGRLSGGCPVWVYAIDNIEDNIARVEFYVNNEYKGNFEPSEIKNKYIYDWRQNLHDFNVNIKAVAFDKSGNSNSTEMDITYYSCTVI